MTFDLEEVRDRIAKALKWDRKGVDSFSLPALRSFVRGKDEELDHILGEIIDSKQHWFQPVKKRRNVGPTR